MGRLRMATAWLGGCSGCHMSFLDLDEWLIDLAGLVDVVYTPLIDVKEYPENVDFCLVEGAVANEDHLHMVRTIRARTRVVVSFGDCAVTGNVTSLRNPLGGPEEVLRRSYLELPDVNARLPDDARVVPPLLTAVTPLHAVILVDVYLPGCPPSPGRIRKALEALAAGRMPELGPEDIKFG